MITYPPVFLPDTGNVLSDLLFPHQYPALGTVPELRGRRPEPSSTVLTGHHVFIRKDLALLPFYRVRIFVFYCLLSYGTALPLPAAEKSLPSEQKLSDACAAVSPHPFQIGILQRLPRPVPPDHPASALSTEPWNVPDPSAGVLICPRSQ